MKGKKHVTKVSVQTSGCHGNLTGKVMKEGWETWSTGSNWTGRETRPGLRQRGKNSVVKGDVPESSGRWGWSKSILGTLQRQREEFTFNLEGKKKI